ncbi:hypothetical protein, conserved [Plasmodium vivax]|nr:hypothetical protein, conserved [Plasmodium vivax]
MKKNMENFNESLEKSKKRIYETLYYKSSKSCVYNSDICMEPKKQMKKHCCKYALKKSSFKSNNLSQFSFNNNVMNFLVKLIVIYQTFRLQFFVAATTEGTDEQEGSGVMENVQRTMKQVGKTISEYTKDLWDKIEKKYEEHIGKHCDDVGILKYICNDAKIAIPVTFSLFILVFSIICLICCKCCCKKSCCKKKENDESDVDYNQFMMGPDGQMYSQMYQGQMMQPEMIPAGMMYPQMYPQMYYQHMYQGA